MSKRNNDKLEKEKALRGYINVLHDAVIQRATPEVIKEKEKEADCIMDILHVLANHGYVKTFDCIDILVKVLVMPSMMLEEDINMRSRHIRIIAERIVSELLSIVIRDQQLEEEEPQIAKEVNKMRIMSRNTWTTYSSPPSSSSSSSDQK